MMTSSMKLSRWMSITLLALSLLAVAGMSVAAPEAIDASLEVELSETAHGEEGGGHLPGAVAIGAALAIGLTALATGMAQARIGAAGIGAIAENPKRIGMVIMLVAIPETVAILGFVIAYLIIS